MNSVDIKIFRHTDHLGNVYGSGLTEEGIEEARSIGRSITRDKDPLWQAYSPDTKRHLGTIVLAMFPTIQAQEIRKKAEMLVSEGRIVINDDLTYEPIKGIPFTQALNVAINNKRAMSFFFEESDNFITPYSNIRSYSVMARILSETLVPIETDSLVCTREYVIPSFRTKVMQIELGLQAVKEYIEWYNERVQENPLARIHVTHITKADNLYLLKDEYGHLEFDKKTLNEMNCTNV